MLLRFESIQTNHWYSFSGTLCCRTASPKIPFLAGATVQSRQKVDEGDETPSQISFTTDPLALARKMTGTAMSSPTANASEPNMCRVPTSEHIAAEEGEFDPQPSLCIPATGASDALPRYSSANTSSQAAWSAPTAATTKDLISAFVTARERQLPERERHLRSYMEQASRRLMAALDQIDSAVSGEPLLPTSTSTTPVVPRNEARQGSFDAASAAV